MDLGLYSSNDFYNTFKLKRLTDNCARSDLNVCPESTTPSTKRRFLFSRLQYSNPPI